MSLIGAAVVAVLGIVMQCAASGHLEAMYIGRYEPSLPSKLTRRLTEQD